MFKGAAAGGTLAVDNGAASLVLTANPGSSWPDGSTGNFYVVVDRGNANEEKVLCSARANSTLTVAASGRGADGTAQITHAAGATVEICLTATDADEANYTVSQTVGQIQAAGDLLVGSGANALTRLAVGATGKVLGVSGGSPAWVNDAILNIIAATGDLVVGTGANTAARLGVGSTGALLEVAGGTAAWLAPSATTGATLRISGGVPAWDTGILAQIIQEFATTTARNAAITSPVTGQTAYVASNDANEGIGSYTSAGVWRLPWNLPWGFIAESTSTTDQTGITTLADATGLSVTFTAVGNRRYRIVGAIAAISTAGSPTFQQLQITNSGNTVFQGGQTLIGFSIAANSFTLRAEAEAYGLTAGSQTVKLRFGRAGGDSATYTIPNSAYTGLIRVEDIGPNGAPA
jgi:hypothetical protein